MVFHPSLIFLQFSFFGPKGSLLSILGCILGLPLKHFLREKLMFTLGFCKMFLAFLDLQLPKGYFLSKLPVFSSQLMDLLLYLL